jgi:hypothetical protein
LYVIIKNKENAAAITDFLPNGTPIKIIEADNHFSKLKNFYDIIKIEKPEIVFA